MKRYLLPIFLLTLTGTSGHASNMKDNIVDNLFKEYSKVENAEYVNVNPFMMRIASVATLFTDSNAAKIMSKVKYVQVLELGDSPADDRDRLSERISAISTDGTFTKNDINAVDNSATENKHGGK